MDENVEQGNNTAAGAVPRQGRTCLLYQLPGLVLRLPDRRRQLCDLCLLPRWLHGLRLLGLRLLGKLLGRLPRRLSLLPMRLRITSRGPWQGRAPADRSWVRSGRAPRGRRPATVHQQRRLRPLQLLPPQPVQLLLLPLLLPLLLLLLLLPLPGGSGCLAPSLRTRWRRHV